jgi:Ca2+-transporting ATPase
MAQTAANSSSRRPSSERPPAWHTLPTEEVASRLQVDPQRGLDPESAERRLREHGPNELVEPARTGPLRMLLRQFTDFMILVLISAAIVAALIGEPVDALAILAIVILNAVIGFVQQWRAERALQALRQLAAPLARVRRGGVIVDIPARELVPGDVVLLESGQAVPADLRLIEAVRLQAQESALTGESEPVDKSVEPLADPSLGIGDRRNSVFKGTYITDGRGVGLVVATGMNTQLGTIAQLMSAQHEVQTPLQRRLAAFGRRLAVIILFVSAITFVLGLSRGEPPLVMFLTAISLGVAAIPEALPAVLTVALALGARRMVRRNALVRSLPAVEALGSVTYICADKTGTLTEGHMRLAKLFVDEREAAEIERSATWQLLGPALALCNDVKPAGNGTATGDPTEIALYETARAAGYVKEELIKTHPRKGELPFSSERKRMTTLHEWRRGTAIENETPQVIAFVKGAPEVVLPLCSGMIVNGQRAPLDRKRLEGVAEALAASGYRVIAIAAKRLTEMPDTIDEEHLERNLDLLCLAALHDPPRAEAKRAVATCFDAGIRPVMITGDHAATARAIATHLGILRAGDAVMTGTELAALSAADLESRVRAIAVYARVSPAQKLNIVKALQQQGETVAMTGDGVNDGPALKRADIGIAMGRTGTDVAREASDLVLLDDNFATIVAAIEEGRRIYDNIRKFIGFAMAANSAEVLTIFVAPLIALPLPLLPIHILWINLVTDGLPGLALANEPAEPDIMRRRPRRRDESIFAGGLSVRIVWVAILIGVLALLVHAWATRTNAPAAQTITFTVVTVAQMALVLAARSQSQSLLTLGLRSNLPLTGAVLLTLALQIAVIYLPAVNGIFRTRPLTLAELGVCTGAAVMVFAAVEAEKYIVRREWISPRRTDDGSFKAGTS